jgi:predicted lactoylglutathione lyase
MKKIFINQPVKDLGKSMAFFRTLGFEFDPQFTDQSAACLILDKHHLFAMLLTEESFRRFTSKEIVDAHRATEAINAIQLESRQKVDQMAALAAEAGGRIYRPSDDYGWMYTQAVEDLDGHQWEFMYIDEKNIPANPSQSQKVA